VAKDLPRLIYHRRALSNKLSLRAATGTSFFPIRGADELCMNANAAGVAYDRAFDNSVYVKSSGDFHKTLVNRESFRAANAAD